jgi:hypothetical protein
MQLCRVGPPLLGFRLPLADLSSESDILPSQSLHLGLQLLGQFVVLTRRFQLFAVFLGGFELSLQLDIRFARPLFLIARFSSAATRLGWPLRTLPSAPMVFSTGKIFRLASSSSRTVVTVGRLTLISAALGGIELEQLGD